MPNKRQKYTITWQGTEHTLCKTAICRLTARSRTFIDDRLREGYTMQQAVDCNPGDAQFRSERRKEHERGPEWRHTKKIEKRESELRKKHQAVFQQFLGGKPCIR